VVGYWAIAVTERGQETGLRLNEEEKSSLLSLARSSIVSYLNTAHYPDPDPRTLPKPLLTNCGAFVTLNKHQSLRGCIGRFDAGEPLYRVVQQMAVAAATQDPRFPAVTASEVKDLEIEISVLTPMRRISSIEDFHLGKQGIYIKKGWRSGTFLPQVARETGWSKEEFLGHCAEDKAGIGWDGWKDAELYVYDAIVFAEQ
jgi:AmmeMemoRadiSam system protein A